jgi:hypothetical protein
LLNGCSPDALQQQPTAADMSHMNEPVNTGQYVRGNRGLTIVHLLGILSVIGVIALTIIAIAGRDATTPTMLTLVGLLFGGLWWRQRRHQSEVIAAIAANHGVQVPHAALFALMRNGDDIEFTHNGTRYRISSTGDPEPGNTEPAQVLLTRL